jgi:orotate phosphoribosyltransferase
LLCEDVLSTGESVELTARAIIEKGGMPMPWEMVLVNRSGLDEVNDKKIIALINHPIYAWTPEECPLCKEGSKALPRPIIIVLILRWPVHMM